MKYELVVLSKAPHAMPAHRRRFFSATLLHGCKDDASSTTEPELTLEEKLTAINTQTVALSRTFELQTDVQTDPILFAEWEELTLFIDKWTNGRDKYWLDQEMAAEGGYLADLCRKHVAGDSEFPADVRKSSPLPNLGTLPSRMLIWYAIEMGFLTEIYFEEGIELLTTAREAFPENPMIPMYLGEAVPWLMELVLRKTPRLGSLSTRTFRTVDEHHRLLGYRAAGNRWPVWRQLGR